MFWPYIVFNNEEEKVPEGYLKDGNRLIKLHNPYAKAVRPMTKKLKTLEEHNKIATQTPQTQGNGIACPNCGSELFDTGVELLSYPPQYKIFCRECNYKGSRW
jgi:DNA-directed RNA polymerase subunit RPC12/RpoP